MEYSLVSIGTNAGCFVVFGAVVVGAVIEGPVAFSDGTSPALVHKMPVEAGEGPVLGAFALYKEGALFHAEFLQISGMRIHRTTHYSLYTGSRALHHCLSSHSGAPPATTYV